MKWSGYYKEFTVDSAGNSASRGAERLVVGQAGEVYYTPNHYGSCARIL
jgi:ribonuclease T1